MFWLLLLTKSRGGGKETDAETGQMVRVRDASESDSNVKALKKSMEGNIPVVIIAGT